MWPKTPVNLDHDDQFFPIRINIILPIEAAKSFPAHQPKDWKIMTKLIKLHETMAQSGLSRSQLYALAQKGAFPKPVKLSERSSAWVQSEVDDWIDARIATRDEEAA